MLHNSFPHGLGSCIQAHLVNVLVELVFLLFASLTLRVLSTYMPYNSYIQGASTLSFYSCLQGTPVKVRRPSDYNPSLAATLGPSQPNPNLNLGAVGLTPGSAGGLEGPDRIFVGGLPYYFTEGQIRELLESFGPLRGFDLVKDRETGNSKGYAFCVYQDLAVTDIACAALNGIKMGDKTLTVRRANQGTTQPKPEQENVLLHAQQQIALQVRRTNFFFPTCGELSHEVNA